MLIQTLFIVIASIALVGSAHFFSAKNLDTPPLPKTGALEIIDDLTAQPDERQDRRIEGEETYRSPLKNTASVKQSGVTPLMIELSYTPTGFTPASTTLSLGSTIKFVNNSAIPMWIASGPHPEHTLYPEFDAKTAVPQGAAYSFTFNKKGAFTYHNHLNPGHVGTVEVQ